MNPVYWKLPLVLLLSTLLGTTALAQNTLVPPGEERYAATAFPDRIILTPTATPAVSQTVNWRTRTSVTEAVAEISEAKDTPALHLTSRQVRGQFQTLRTDNGTAHHHRVTFTGLQPDTLYAYRVRGDNTWSEWFQFRTATDGFEPHTALYFGDAQNAVKSHFSRVIRQAHGTAPEAQVMVHAGDMVNGRDGNHDDEWGEWFDAGGWLHGMVNSIPAFGNHEYVSQPDGPRLLMSHVPAQLGVPANGPAPLQDTVYYVDYQGVRYIALDSMEALQNEDLARLQADWLRGVLEDNPNRWTVVTHHHPMFSVSRGRDNPPLREHWKPVYEEYGVHLVLQGHDHTYGRGQNLATGASGQMTEQGPMYVVSVAGPKMYRISDEAMESMDRLAEDTQLFQVIHFGEDRITYEAQTVTGQLYDAFDIVRTDAGVRIEDLLPDGETNLCGNEDASRSSSCWSGSDFIQFDE
ncbi:MAG: fibronectin type III domain-containing protein [Pseudomonadota bacterium]